MYKKLLFLLLLLIFASCAQRMSPPELSYALDMAAMPPAPQAELGFQRQMLGDGGVDSWLFGTGDYEFMLNFQYVQMDVPRLLIQTASVQLESENFGDAVDFLRNVPVMFGGYTESERLFTVRWQWQFEVVMRIPAAEFENALAQIRQVAYTRHLVISSEDVTDLFFDTESRLATRLIEEDRILALIDRTTVLDDLLELERRLALTRLAIERYRSSLANMAGRITYSTIVVNLWDIEDAPYVAAAVTFGERVGGAFGSSIDGTIRAFQFFVVVLAGAIVPLTLVLAIAYVSVKLYRRIRQVTSIPRSSI